MNHGEVEKKSKLMKKGGRGEKQIVR